MMCAGVQNVSRPTDMCHEMSQWPPMTPEEIPATMHQIVQGIDSRLASARPARACTGCPRGMVSAIAGTPLRYSLGNDPFGTCRMQAVYTFQCQLANFAPWWRDSTKRGSIVRGRAAII